VSTYPLLDSALLSVIHKVSSNITADQCAIGGIKNLGDLTQKQKSTLFIVLLQDGFTPIDVAVQQGHEKVVAALLHHDSRVRMFYFLITFYLILNV